jgi:AraC-like DNA-binding protein
MHSANSESTNNPVGWGHGAPSHGTKSAASLSPKIRRVAADLRQCFQQPITLRQVSAVVDLHSDYLSRRFKCEIGVGLLGLLGPSSHGKAIEPAEPLRRVVRAEFGKGERWGLLARVLHPAVGHRRHR